MSHTLSVHVYSVHRNIDFRPPGYAVDVAAEEVKLTYLDTVGRPVVVCTANNLVEQHIQEFQLEYTFDSVMLLQEPLLLVVALYLFFLFVIAVVRLDFAITTVSLELIVRSCGVIVACFPGCSCSGSSESLRDHRFHPAVTLQACCSGAELSVCHCFLQECQRQWQLQFEQAKSRRQVQGVGGEGDTTRKGSAA